MELYKSIANAFKDGTSFADVDIKKGIVSGYFSAFDIKDSDDDIIRKGAYAKTIQEQGPKSSFPRIKHLIDHNTERLFTNLQELDEVDFGLRYVGIAGRHQDAQDFLMKVEDKLITEHSVRITPIKQKILPGLQANEITECKMKEGSSLHCWGANQFTPILSVEKSLADIQVLYKRLKKALTTGTYTDKSMLEFQTVYDQIGELLKTTQPEPDKRKATTEPDDSQTLESQINFIDKFKNVFYNGTN